MNKDSAYVEAILKEYGEIISVPAELLVSPRYNKEGDRDRLRWNSALLYGFLLRMKKQIAKDENDNVYVNITGNEIASIIGTTTGSVPRNMIKQLEEFNLIERISTKQGHPYKLHIKEIER